METAIIITGALCAGFGTALACMEIKRHKRRRKVIITEYIPLYRIRKSGGKKKNAVKKEKLQKEA